MMKIFTHGQWQKLICCVKKKLNELDCDHLIEELESMGGSERRELVNRMAQLIMHLLKWQFQTQLKCRSWQISIKKQRVAVKRILASSPSLKSKMSLCLIEAYEDALYDAMEETGLEEKTFPTECPYTFDQLMDESFYPE